MMYGPLWATIYGLLHHNLWEKHPKVLKPPICILLKENKIQTEYCHCSIIIALLFIYEKRVHGASPVMLHYIFDMSKTHELQEYLKRLPESTLFIWFSVMSNFWTPANPRKVLFVSFSIWFSKSSKIYTLLRF